MLEEIKNPIAFLTIIPVGLDPDCLADAADYMYLFPVARALIELLAGLFAWLLLHVISASIVSILTLGFINYGLGGDKMSVTALVMAGGKGTAFFAGKFVFKF